MDLLSRLVPTGTKGCARHVALAAPFVPVGITNRDKRVLFSPVTRPGIKGHPLLSRPGVPGWETGTIGVSQPGQINIFVVVEKFFDRSLLRFIDHCGARKEESDFCSPAGSIVSTDSVHTHFRRTDHVYSRLDHAASLLRTYIYR